MTSYSDNQQQNNLHDDTLNSEFTVSSKNVEHAIPVPNMPGERPPEAIVVCNVEDAAEKLTNPEEAVLESEWMKQKRRRTSFTAHQLAELQAVFTHTHYPNAMIRQLLALRTQLPESRIQVWFQNRRALFKKQRKQHYRLHRLASTVAVDEDANDTSNSANLNYSWLQQQPTVLTLWHPWILQRHL